MFFKKIIFIVYLMVAAATVAMMWLMLFVSLRSLGSKTMVKTFARTEFSSKIALRAMAPILTHDKNRIIDHYEDPSVRNKIASGGLDKEVLWATDNDIWQLNLGAFGQYPAFEVGNIFPIKQVAVSSDGKYVAYSVRRYPLPKMPNYAYRPCFADLGDTVLVHDRTTGAQTVIYSSTSTEGVGNLQFLPGRQDVIFTDQKVYQFDQKIKNIKQLLGFDSETESHDVYVDTCNTFAFYAFSPDGRYGLAYDRGHFWAVDKVYDFQDEKFLGTFVYPWDDGGKTILGFVANDWLLVYDNSFSNFQRSYFPRLSIFDLQGNEIMNIVTTSRASTFSLPNVFATSSLGWHFLLYLDAEEGESIQSMIFNPETFSVTSSSAKPPISIFDVVWSQGDATSSIVVVGSEWEKNVMFSGAIRNVVSR